MTMLSRVKERCETDLSDTELQDVIDEAMAEVIDRFGPHADAGQPLTVYHAGARKYLQMARPVDEGETIVVTEYTQPQFGEPAETILAADDYRVLHGGRMVERLNTGTNRRRLWDATVKLVYTPINDGNQRQEVVIKMTMLTLTYRGLNKNQEVGDVKLGGSMTADAYTKERESLLATLKPRKGVMLT